jgi:hypothetical protein
MLQCRSSKLSTRKCLFGAGQIYNRKSGYSTELGQSTSDCAGPRHSPTKDRSCPPRQGHFFQLAPGRYIIVGAGAHGSSSGPIPK